MPRPGTGARSHLRARRALCWRDRQQTAPWSARHQCLRLGDPVTATAGQVCPRRTRRPVSRDPVREAGPAGPAYSSHRANGHSPECERTSPSSVPPTPIPGASLHRAACHSRQVDARPESCSARRLVSANPAILALTLMPPTSCAVCAAAAPPCRLRAACRWRVRRGWRAHDCKFREPLKWCATVNGLPRILGGDR
jgi:hypothetical protein